jgi:hypothetical protein
MTILCPHIDLHVWVNEKQRNSRTVAVCFAVALITTGLPAIAQLLLNFRLWFLRIAIVKLTRTQLYFTPNHPSCQW